MNVLKTVSKHMRNTTRSLQTQRALEHRSVRQSVLLGPVNPSEGGGSVRLLPPVDPLSVHRSERRFVPTSCLSLGNSLVVLGVLWGALTGLSCSEEKREQLSEPIEVPQSLCPTGLSEDPPRSAQEPGIRAFGDKDYVGTQRIFGELANQYQGSAAARVWQGDAVLFDKDKEEREAARLARPYYEAARKLHESGCRLQRRPLYYLFMGEAYGALRLAKTESGYDRSELERAESSLAQAAVEFPTSAEIPYNRARVACALAQNQSGAVERAQLEICSTQFRLALEVAERLDRPRFLRTHRSTQDWIVRSRTQSEFGPLRQDQRYEALIRAMLDRE